MMPGVPRLVVTRLTASRARDRIDAGADVLITDDPGLASYAREHDTFVSATPVWDRTFVVLVPERGVGRTTARDSLVALQRALASDVVRAEASVVEETPWSSVAWACVANTPSRALAPSRLRAHRIVYERYEETSRGIAERLAALASMAASSDGRTVLASVAPELVKRGVSLRAIGLNAKEFIDAFAAGRDAAYVISLPKRSLAVCPEIEELRQRAPWIAEHHLIPLVDTRRQVLVRRGRVGVRASYDGTLRLVTSSERARP
jgi:hypothetical protein